MTEELNICQQTKHVKVGELWKMWKFKDQAVSEGCPCCAQQGGRSPVWIALPKLVQAVSFLPLSQARQCLLHSLTRRTCPPFCASTKIKTKRGNTSVLFTEHQVPTDRNPKSYPKWLFCSFDINTMIVALVSLTVSVWKHAAGLLWGLTGDVSDEEHNVSSLRSLRWSGWGNLRCEAHTDRWWKRLSGHAWPVASFFFLLTKGGVRCSGYWSSRDIVQDGASVKVKVNQKKWNVPNEHVSV